MLGKFVLWLCSVVFAFSLGAHAANPSPSDSELKQKVRDHIDVIVDEAAGIADDVAEEIRNDERGQEAAEFADSVKEIVDNTRQDIEDHFGSGEEVPTEEAPVEEAPAAEAEAAPVEETPAEEVPLEEVSVEDDSPRSDG